MDLYSQDSGTGKSLDDLLARSDIHAVIICLPIFNQPEYIRKALLASKHVLSEKPVAENVKDGQALIQWYRAEIDTTKVTWAVAEQFRFLGCFNHAARSVEQMGRILQFRLRKQGLMDGGKYYETE